MSRDVVAFLSRNGMFARKMIRGQRFAKFHAHIAFVCVLIAAVATAAHAAPEIRDYPVKASGENRSVSLTVSHFQLAAQLGSHFSQPGQLYLVMRVEWRNKLPVRQGQSTADVPVPQEHLFLLFNGDRRAFLDPNSRQTLLDSKNPALKPLALGNVQIPLAQGVVAGDYVFQLPADGVKALDLVYESADGSIRIPLQRGPAESLPKPIASPARLGDLEISLFGAREAETVGSQQSPRGQEYFVLDVRLANRNPAKLAQVWDGQFSLRDAQGTEYHGVYIRGLDYRLNPGGFDIAAGIPLRGNYAFSVPSAHYALSLAVKATNGAVVQFPIPDSGPPAPLLDHPLFTLKTDDGVTIGGLGVNRATTIGQLKPQGMKTFEIVELSASSEADKPLQINPAQFALALGDLSIPTDNPAAYALAAQLEGSQVLAPHGKRYFGLVFDVPPEAKHLVLQYKEADGITLQHPLPEPAPPKPGSTSPLPSGTNLASPDIGGEIESMTRTFGPGFTGRNLLVEKAPSWAPENGVAFPYDIVLSFYKRSPALVSAVVATLADDTSLAPKDVEVWVSTTSATEGFTKVATAAVNPKVRDQVIGFSPVMARFVRFRIVSGNSRFALGLSKLKVIEGSKAGYTPLLKQYPQIADWKYTPRRSAQLGIEFLQPFTAKWQTEHQCYGCHIQSQTLMGLAIASRNNYVVSPDFISGTVGYLDDKQAPEGFISDAERVAGTQFAAMALAYVEGDASPDPHLARAADWLISQQKPSGEVPMDRIAPPICADSIESTANAVTAFVHAWRQSKAEKYREAADRGLAFIAGAKPATTQDETFTIVALSLYGKPEQRPLVEKLVAQLKSEQLVDGGWREGPKASGSSAFATGQVLYAFKTAGVPVNSPEFTHGVVYLVQTQEPNGSWLAENTLSGAKTVDAPTMWAVIGLAGSFDGKVAEPNVKRDEAEIECQKLRKLAALLDKNGKIILYINFDFDKATLRPDAMPTIEQITTLLKTYPELRLEVDGHTDNIGTAARNLALSRQRAETVVQALVARGIDPRRLSSAGFGMRRPIASNSTPEGRFRNRRVELIRKSSSALAGAPGAGACGALPAAASAPPVTQLASTGPALPSPPARASSHRASPPATRSRVRTQTASAKPVRMKVQHVRAEAELETAHARLQLTQDTWVFTEPDEASSHVARVHAQKYLIVTGSTVNYVRVRLRSGKVGYVSASAVRLVEPANTVFAVLHDSPVYEKPNQHSKHVSQVHAPGRVRVIGHALGYMQVRMHNGVEGFVPDKAFN